MLALPPINFTARRANGLRGSASRLFNDSRDQRRSRRELMPLLELRAQCCHDNPHPIPAEHLTRAPDFDTIFRTSVSYSACGLSSFAMARLPASRSMAILVRHCQLVDSVTGSKPPVCASHASQMRRASAGGSPFGFSYAVLANILEVTAHSPGDFVLHVHANDSSRSPFLWTTAGFC